MYTIPSTTLMYAPIEVLGHVECYVCITGPIWSVYVRTEVEIRFLICQDKMSRQV